MTEKRSEVALAAELTNSPHMRLDASNTLTLIGALNVASITEIHAELARVLDAAPVELVIDMSGVTELDTAGLQLLLVLRRSIPHSRVHSCPAGLRDLIDRVGLTQVLT